MRDRYYGKLVFTVLFYSMLWVACFVELAETFT